MYVERLYRDRFTTDQEIIISFSGGLAIQCFLQPSDSPSEPRVACGEYNRQRCAGTQVLEGLRAEAMAADQAHTQAVAAARQEESQLWQERLRQAEAAAQQQVREAPHAIFYTCPAKQDTSSWSKVMHSTCIHLRGLKHTRHSPICTYLGT